MLVAFMGVSSVIASEIYSTTLQREKERELLFIGHQFRDAIGFYYESTIGGAAHQYPATLDDLLKDPRYPNTQRHLRRLYVDPITGKAEWGIIILQGKIVGVHSLSDKKPIKIGSFEPNDVALQNKEKYSEWEFTYPINLIIPKTTKEGDPAQPASNDPFPLK